MFTTRTLLAVTLAGIALLAACGGDDDSTPSAAAAPPPTAAQAPEPAPEGSTVAVRTGETDVGPALVGPNGLTLYGFTNDLPTESNCDGTCADAWPPVIVGANWTVAPGVDSGIFNTITRDDGRLQLVGGRWPLYYYAGDSVPGDTTGHGSGDVWFVVGTDGRLIEETTEETTDETGEPSPADSGDPYADETAAPAAEPAPISIAESAFGELLVDADGFTLYGFTNDDAGHPTCNDACADAWPPSHTGSEELPTGLDPDVFGVTQRDDGSFQLLAGKWPLYRFAGDAAPGETNGQGSGDVWFLVDPTGGLITS